MKEPDALAAEFRLVMKGFDVYLEQSPNPGALKNHIAAALKLNAQIHRLAALKDAEMAIAGYVAVIVEPNHVQKHVEGVSRLLRALKEKRT